MSDAERVEKLNSLNPAWTGPIDGICRWPKLESAITENPYPSRCASNMVTDCYDDTKASQEVQDYATSRVGIIQGPIHTGWGLAFMGVARDFHLYGPDLSFDPAKAVLF
jgi:hypothetical protein